MILELERVEAFYGTSHVLQGIDLAVGEGETVALLGRNGVGKTTTLRAIMGLTPPRSGSVRFQGRQIAGAGPDAVARPGVAWVPDDPASSRRSARTRTSRSRGGSRGGTAPGTGGGWSSCSPS